MNPQMKTRERKLNVEIKRLGNRQQEPATIYIKDLKRGKPQPK